MKKFFPLFFAFAIIFFVHANAETSPRMAPNMYVDWDYFSPDGYDAMSVDWFCEQDAKNTYWAVLGWDRGYAGFQNVGGNYVLLISLWNLGADLRPISDDTTVPAYRPTIEYSKDRTGGDFGGEGTGKNIFTNFDWQSEKWYTMRVQSWTADGKSFFGQWVREENGEWIQAAIISYPVPNLNFSHGSMFQEDFTFNNFSRAARLKNAYGLEKNSHEWISWQDFKISNTYFPTQPEHHDQWDGHVHRNINFNCDWELAPDASYVRVQSGGGDFSQNGKPAPPVIFRVNQPAQPSSPDWINPFFDDAPDCAIGTQEFIFFGDALANVKNGETIKLLRDVNHHRGIVIHDKKISIDVNGFILNVTSQFGGGPYGDALGVYNSALNLICENGGELNISTHRDHPGMVVENGTATVTNATGGFGGIYATRGSVVTVLGNVTNHNSDTDGVYALDASKITINGKIFVPNDSRYVNLGGFSHARSANAADSSKQNYFEYRDGENFIWVGATHGGGIPNSDLTWELNAVTGVLTISGVGEMPDYIIFELANGTRIGGGELIQTIANGAATAPEVSRDGWIFDGWDARFEFVTENLTLTAQWLRLGAVSSGGVGDATSADIVFLARHLAKHAGFEILPDKRVANIRGENRNPEPNDITMLVRWLVGYDLEYLKART